MTEKVYSGTVQVEYDIYEDQVDGSSAFWWVSSNGIEEDEWYSSLEDAKSAAESYFG